MGIIMVHKPIYNWETIQIRGYCHANKTKMGAGHHFAQNPAQKKGRWNPSFSRSNLDTTLQKKQKHMHCWYFGICSIKISAQIWVQLSQLAQISGVSIPAPCHGVSAVTWLSSTPSERLEALTGESSHGNMSLTRPGKLTVCEVGNGHRNSEFSQL